MIPTIAHLTAETRHLSWEERALWKRNRRFLSGWEERFWDRHDRLDLLCDLLPAHADKLRRIRVGVTMADLGRYAFLFRFGGFYFDTDYKVIGSLEPFRSSTCLLPLEEPYTGQKSGIAYKIGNAVLGSVPGYRLWIDFLRSTLETRSLEEINTANPVMLSGPVALTEFWAENRLAYADATVLGYETFFPRLRFANFGYACGAETAGVHLCWGSWRNRTGVAMVKNFARRKISCLY